MVTTEERLDMKCRGHELLAEHMTYNKRTVRDLADDVERRLRKIDKSAKYTHQALGHLRSGKRSICPRRVAWAIEDELRVPRGTLFVEQVSTVSVERRRAS